VTNACYNNPDVIFNSESDIQVVTVVCYSQ